MRSFGLDINNAADRTLLLSRMDSPAVMARGFKPPYPGFPPGQVLAQALRPFPQFAGQPTAFNLYPVAIPVYWNPMGKTWYDVAVESDAKAIAWPDAPEHVFVVEVAIVGHRDW
ncbi:MAG: hypothetical protein AUI91_04000 [Acidobacteria bacterium 13_1_40CM_3_56_11]|nr:MAG: hypothetical protein AUI91_04000 [Acidobacteria bacterium 13_1_40CM_3_56_11]